MADAGFLTNRELFSNHYLTRLLPETGSWDRVEEDRLDEAAREIEAIYDDPLLSEYNEDQLRNNVLDPVFEVLGLTMETEETLATGRRRPDYAFFEDDDARQSAFERRREDGDFYADALAVGDAKYWDRPLDTRGEGESERDFGNPSYQIHVYLDSTGLDWGILTNGRKWRLYYGPTSHKLDSYYEIDLPALLSEGVDAFKYFYLFFRREAFVSDSSGTAFLDRVREQSNTFAQELGEDVQENIYEAIPLLAEGFLSGSDLDSTDLEAIHDASLTYLYRLIFVLYAESEGRELLETDNRIYSRDYSLNTIKREVADELDGASPRYTDWQTQLWDRLNDLFALIDRGSEAQRIPREELYVPAYNGGLFSTEPGPGDRPEASFLQEYSVGDSYLARVIELLTRRESEKGSGRTFVDYSSLDIRHLGSIYEGLLEYELNVAAEPLVAVREDGEEQWVPKAELDGESVTEEIESGTVYLTTDKGERKATGSYYTPEYVVQYIVEETLDPLLEEIREDLLARDQWGRSGGETNVADAFAERGFELKILDPAMGSGHFLTNAIDHLARAIVEAQEKQADTVGEETVDESHDIHWARRQVAQQCIYGVDLNDMAVELAEVSLWLRTLAAEQPLAFLDHHLKTGNSLVGSDIEEIEGLEAGGGADAGPNRALTEFGMTRRGTIEHLMEIYQEFVAIENRELADAKEMERKYREIEQDTLRNRLVGMANVHTAEKFDVKVPSGAYERMGEAINDEAAWNEIENTDWYREAQDHPSPPRYLHWRLEFPEVFYRGDGSEKANPGFDAVIGNPPWVDVKGLGAPDVLFDLFATAFNRVNIYGAFFEQSADLVRENGFFGFITPNSFMTQSSYKKLRKHLLKRYQFNSFVRLPDNVFAEVTMETVISIFTKIPKSTDRSVDVKIYNRDSVISQIHSSRAITKKIDTRYWFDNPHVFDIFTSNSDRKLISKIERAPYQIGDLFETCLGVTPYDKYEGHSESQINDRTFHSNDKKSDNYYKITTGEGIRRHNLSWEGGEWIRYGEWLGAPREKRFFTGPRCIVRQIVSGGVRSIKATYTDEEMFHTQVGFVLLPNENKTLRGRNLAGILNSKLLNIYHKKKFLDENKDTFQKILIQDAKQFPIPEDVDNKELYQAVKSIENSIAQRRALNLSLLDHLGTYDDGPTLTGIGFAQPPTGITESILSETTETRTKLGITDVFVERDEPNRVTVSAEARYKPDDPADYETDSNDYRYVGPFEVLHITDLTEREADLIEVFVPVAVDEEMAGFRKNAAKTISPIDRLEKVTLPQPDDVAGGVERYRRTKSRADELDEKIEKTDELIDEIVYELYGLTDEEIEIVEEAVSD